MELVADTHVANARSARLLMRLGFEETHVIDHDRHFRSAMPPMPPMPPTPSSAPASGRRAWPGVGPSGRTGASPPPPREEDR